MDLKKIFPSVLSELANSLSTQGFMRQGMSFSRDNGQYIEHFVFQASANNVSSIKRRYYLNVGLEFPRLSPAAVWAYKREGGLVSWLGNKSVSLQYVCPRAVWGTRARNLLPLIAEHWEVEPESNLPALQQEIGDAILSCSKELPAWAYSLRSRVWKAKILGPLAWPFIRHKLNEP